MEYVLRTGQIVDLPDDTLFKMRIRHKIAKHQLEIQHRREVINYWTRVGRPDLAESLEKRIFDFELEIVVLQRELDKLD